MAIYLRKSIRVGSLRFNLSKSGVGVSAGIKGFRVGTGQGGTMSTWIEAPSTTARRYLRHRPQAAPRLRRELHQFIR